MTIRIRQPIADFDVPEMILITAGHAVIGTSEEDIEYYRQLSGFPFRAWYQSGIHAWEQPRHAVWLKPYKIARYPTTNRQYAAFVQATGHPPPPEWPRGTRLSTWENHPVVSITWHDAIAYCDWLSRLSAESYRLPTEAEWEHAARGANSHFRWPWGSDWEQGRCNMTPNGYGSITAVDTFEAKGISSYGVADCIGNVAEWCSTRWGSLWARPDFPYPYTLQDKRELRESGDLRIVRGGSFRNGLTDLRCAARSRFSPEHSLPTLGFRCACDT